MFWSGLFLLAFVTYHLAHFTLGLTHPEFLELRDPLGHHDAYSMFVKGFQDPLVSASYIVSMLLLALHLSHGVTSMFQSVGLNGRKSWPIIAKIGPAIAIIVAVGNISMPLAVMGALVRLPPGVN